MKIKLVGEELQERFVRAIEKIKPVVGKDSVIGPIGIHHTVFPDVLCSRIVFAPVISRRHPLEVELSIPQGDPWTRVHVSARNVSGQFQDYSSYSYRGHFS